MHVNYLPQLHDFLVDVGVPVVDCLECIIGHEVIHLCLDGLDLPPVLVDACFVVHLFLPQSTNLQVLILELVFLDLVFQNLALEVLLDLESELALPIVALSSILFDEYLQALYPFLHGIKAFHI